MEMPAHGLFYADILHKQQLMEYFVGMAIVGIAALGMAWMPALSSFLRISYAIIYILLGILLFSILPMLPTPTPLAQPEFTTHITEIVLLVALMGSGLKIDQPFSFKKWVYPLRLVSIGMIACIAVTAFVAWYFVGMDIGSAILLGAILSPTDPVLAGDVQVGPPHEGEKESVRFTLTAEGGMNDGTAFPFVWLGILIATGAVNQAGGWLEWTGYYLIYKLLAGLAVGWLLGKLLGYVLFSLPEKFRTTRIEDGFVALSITLLVYGVTELIHGYGFIAVFACATTLRNYEMGHHLHTTLHAFSDQVERMLVAIVLLLFGGSLVEGLLDHLTWPLAIAGIAFLFVIRPLTTALALVRTKMLMRERAMVSFFGIRGVGSLYYMGYAAQQAKLTWVKPMWSMVGFVVLLSVVIHGLTAGSAINKLERSDQAAEAKN
jgi:sodium/hydrogen antiporter